MVELILSLGVILAVVAFAAVAGMLVLRNLLFVCGPNEALVFSGRTFTIGDQSYGYRIIKGGRAFRWPIIETVDRVDLTNMIIEVSVANAYSRGGIPLTVQGVANIKIAGHAPRIHNALQRFLGMSRQEIAKIAKDTLEGNLRGVLSQLTPEEINEDKNAFEEKLLEEAEQDLSRLGLVLDTLKIQNVSDEVGYLNSIGRKQSAEVVKRARIAEAEAKAISVQRDAENSRASRIAAIDAETAVVRASTDRRIRDAQTRKDAMVAEELGKVKAAIAKATAELAVQEARVEQVRRRLDADVVAPARAAMEASQANAKGDASKIVEDGKATVAVLEEMLATWKAGGDHARDIFLMQKLQTLLGSLVSTIDQVQIERLTVLPAADSQAGRAVRWVEEIKGTTGVDVPALVNRFGGGGTETREAAPTEPPRAPRK